MEINDKREIGKTCDSMFIEKLMPKVEKVIRKKYHRMSCDVPIFLFLRNTGGHGTNWAVITRREIEDNNVTPKDTNRSE